MVPSDVPQQLLAAKNFSIDLEEPPKDLNVFYIVSEVLVAIVAVTGNALVVAVFRKERRLRRRTNYYIVSLAAADFLVGLLGIPFALLAAVGLPRNLHACLFTVSLLVVLCTISIFCLVAVSVDRYWAILYPMAYSRHVRTKTALVIISICWFAGTIIGFLPLMGWHQDVPNDAQCFFLKVMDYNYLVFLYIVTIITPAFLLAGFYTHIYRVVLKQLRQIVTMNPEDNTIGRSSGGTMLRVLGAAQKREVKATQNLSIIVLFFMICWIPLYTINFILAFCADCFEVNSTVMLFCIILSHLNSAGNPLLYAYHLRDFRAALKHFLFGGRNQQLIGITGINGRNSLASNNYYVHHRLQSLRETRSALALSANSKYFSDPHLSIEKKISKSHSLPHPPKIAAIVPNTTTIAAVPAGDVARDIWRISEEEPSKTSSRYRNPNNKRSGSDTSGRINGGFMEVHPDFDDEGDDDVFYDNLAPTTISYENITFPDSPALSKFRKNCLSSSSPQLTRNFFVAEPEADRNEEQTGAVKYGRSCSVVEPQQKTYHFVPSPVKTLKLSPLKAVGEFFKFQSAKHSKSATKLDMSSDETEKYSPNNGIGVT